MERITYACEMKDVRRKWIQFASSPPEGVELPCKDQMDARACIQKWDPSGSLQWRIVKVRIVTERDVVAYIGGDRS